MEKRGHHNIVSVISLHRPQNTNVSGEHISQNILTKTILTECDALFCLN